ncbi:MAG: recombinase RecA [Cenarchaeum sp. SB0665_bin_23]|nr:recombinase RecA [Cenarchaeum sp. SB0665_bin_23]
MMCTGIGEMDRFLGGSLLPGTILDIYGPGGAGKTQALIQITSGVVQAGYKVGYIDATGSFRPERIRDICQDDSALDRIQVCRVTNVVEQMASIHRFDDVSMVVLDNVTDLFTYEYYKENKQYIRNQRFATHMQEMSCLALSRRIPIIISNMMRYSGGENIENLDYIIDLYTHVKLHLAGPPKYAAHLSLAHREMQFQYVITHTGIRSIS